MAVDNRSTSALFKRAEQIRRWQESDTNKQEISDNHRTRKVNFTDGCIFLAACAAGDKQEVIRLLEKGADIDTANVDGLTALHAACIDDNLDMVEFLVDQGTDVNRGDMEGWTPLHATASCGFNSIAKFLIDRGADLSLVNNDGDLAIDIADSDEMEMLLQQEIESRGIDCEASRNREERRMLEDAQHWLQSGYLADRPHSKTGATALHVASAKGYIKVMSLLIEAGADINAKDNDGWTPLHAAAHWGQREAIEILCENMADMEVRNFVGQSAFDVADNSLLRLMDELKKKQAALKLVNQNKQVPRKRKTSPHREHSNKKEREDSRESDEKRNKVNKENATPQIIPTSVLSNKNRTQSEARSENAFDESEVQSWRRPSSFRKNNQEDKNQKEEASRTSSTTTITTTTATTTTTTTTASTPTPSARISGRDAEEERKRSAGAEKEESALTATRERLKARSCPALSLLEEEEEGKEGGNGLQVFPSWPSSHLGGVSSTSASSLVASQRLSSSDINLPSQSPSPSPVVPPSQTKGTTSTQQVTSIPSPSPSAVTTTPSITSTTPSITSTTPATPVTPHTTSPSRTVTTTSSASHDAKDLLTMVTTAAPTVTSVVSQSVSSSIGTTGIVSSPPHRPLGPSLSNPISSVPSFPPSSLLPSIPSSSTVTTITTTTPAGLASLSTNHTTNSKDPRLLARSASLRERIQRNHMDSMEPHVSSGAVLTTNTSPTTRSKGSNNVTTLTTNGGLSTLPPPPKTAPSLPNSTPPASTKQPSPSPSPSPPIATTTTKPPTPPPAPPQTPPSAQPPAPTAKMSPGGVIKNFFNLLHSSRSFMPPSRDEESETQRKAHAKMVRSTRRSTQGVTLEDLKSAEQLMKNKQQQQQATSSSPESKETSSTTTATTTTATTTTTTTSPTSPNKPKPDSPTKADDEERRPSWRLKVDDTDKNRFSLENVRSKDKPEVENDADTPTFTVQLRKKNTEEKDEEKESERNSQTREGTQAAIQRRKKPKRRSTGKVQVNMDEIDPEKRAQRSAEQQQRQGEEGSDDDEEEAETVSVAEDGITLARCVLDNQSVSEKGDAARGSTTSLGSALSSRAASRSSSVGPENGDIDYKKLYEEQLAETHRVNERLRLTENELRQSRESIDLNTKKFNTRLAIAESEKREKRSLERKLSEMEEELKQLQKLKAENEKLKAENRALTRVVSKLTNSATSGMGSLATLSK
ncbi:protein phosphatase 1 regulatory subunit 12C-like isoform X4 [Eriocheir sinensis]|uniref:protein phosphatase 1 regulatory subunit 12C-like isoform X4 n=1 Tax=Eriocheir sinensis TaxID=95602 RepID=UPI0021C6F09F|nr:protein phosphatase 1 regulatory subunit 12C-like isoform X4 [Eriocheir sinensis]